MSQYQENLNVPFKKYQHLKFLKLKYTCLVDKEVDKGEPLGPKSCIAYMLKIF